MKKLLIVPFFLLTLLSCNKEKAVSEYIVSVSGDDYADDLRITYGTEYSYENKIPAQPLVLSGGEAVIKAYRKDLVSLSFMPHGTGEGRDPAAPAHQNFGDVVHIVIYRKLKNGNKGDMLGEADVKCTGFVSDVGKIAVEW